VVHLLLHWRWIAGSARRILGRSWRLVLVLLAPALLVWILWSMQSDEPTYRSRHGVRSDAGQSCQTAKYPHEKAPDSRRRRRRMRRRIRHPRARSSQAAGSVGNSALSHFPAGELY
jgi:hypothetical protein